MLRTKSVLQASTHKPLEAHPDDTLLDVHPKLCEHNAVVVVESTGGFVGIVTRKNAIRAILDRPDWKSVRLHEIMTRDVLYIPNHVTLAEAAKVMLEADIHQLVITGPPEGGSVAIGILTLQDVVRQAV
jgi:signal-transduction protein with cAMP-binding, CBS, and nucleotidyltransferase domain